MTPADPAIRKFPVRSCPHEPQTCPHSFSFLLSLHHGHRPHVAFSSRPSSPVSVPNANRHLFLRRHAAPHVRNRRSRRRSAYTPNQQLALCLRSHLGL